MFSRNRTATFLLCDECPLLLVHSLKSACIDGEHTWQSAYDILVAEYTPYIYYIYYSSTFDTLSFRSAVGKYTIQASHEFELRILDATTKLYETIEPSPDDNSRL
jgi:hypothetical protein